MNPQRIGLALQTGARRRGNGLAWARIGHALSGHFGTYGCHVVCSANVF